MCVAAVLLVFLQRQFVHYNQPANTVTLGSLEDSFVLHCGNCVCWPFWAMPPTSTDGHYSLTRCQGTTCTAYHYYRCCFDVSDSRLYAQTSTTHGQATRLLHYWMGYKTCVLWQCCVGYANSQGWFSPLPTSVCHIGRLPVNTTPATVCWIWAPNWMFWCSQNSHLKKRYFSSTVARW